MTFTRVGEIITMVDKNSDGEIDFNEFLACMEVLKSGGSFGTVGGASSAMSQFAGAAHKAATVIQVKGAHGTHSISEEEREAFAEHINNVLGSDPYLASRLPMDPQSPTALFDQCKVPRPVLFLLPQMAPVLARYRPNLACVRALVPPCSLSYLKTRAASHMSPGRNYICQVDQRGRAGDGG